MPDVLTPGTTETILPSIKLAYGFLKNLLEGVTPDTFARTPEGIACNHPAFVLGHLSLYPAKVLAGLGVEGAWTIEDERTRALFDAGSECVDDAEGSIYPPMDRVVADFDRAMESLIAKLPEVRPERYAVAPKGTSFDGLMPTMGAMAAFVLVAHPMMHAGQLSTWRRAMGLGPASLR